MVRLAVIGLVVGLFSALFGVGGGIIVVALLTAWVGLSQREAMATSLAAVGITALAGAAAYALHGELRVGPAALVGLPGAVGAVAGAAIQQRLHARTLSLAFAGLVVAVGLRLLV